jgi:hypothetical protein
MAINGGPPSALSCYSNCKEAKKMEDALAIIGQWIGLIKAAKFALAEVSRDCEEQVAEGTVAMEEDFREAVDSVFEALSTLLVRLEEQEEALEEELEDEEEEE